MMARSIMNAKKTKNATQVNISYLGYDFFATSWDMVDAKVFCEIELHFDHAEDDGSEIVANFEMKKIVKLGVTESAIKKAADFYKSRLHE